MRLSFCFFFDSSFLGADMYFFRYSAILKVVHSAILYLGGTGTIWHSSRYGSGHPHRSGCVFEKKSTLSPPIEGLDMEDEDQVDILGDFCLNLE